MENRVASTALRRARHNRPPPKVDTQVWQWENHMPQLKIKMLAGVFRDHVHGRRKDFFREGPLADFYKNFSKEWPKVVKFVFSHSKRRKQSSLPKFSKSSPPFRHPWLRLQPRSYLKRQRLRSNSLQMVLKFCSHVKSWSVKFLSCAGLTLKPRCCNKTNQCVLLVMTFISIL